MSNVNTTKNSSIKTAQNTAEENCFALTRVWKTTEESLLELSRPMLRESRTNAGFDFILSERQKKILALSESLLREKCLAYGLTLMAIRKAANGITRKQFSKKSFIPLNRLRLIEEGDAEITSDEIRKMERVVSISPITVHLIAKQFLRTNMNEDFIQDLRIRISNTNPYGGDLFELFEKHPSGQFESVTNSPALSLLAVRMYSMSSSSN